jgi:hypothetical protein
MSKPFPFTQWPLDPQYQYPDDSPCHLPRRRAAGDIAKDILIEAGIVHGGNLPTRLHKAIGTVFRREIEAGNEIQIHKIGVIGYQWNRDKKVYISAIKGFKWYQPRYKLILHISRDLKERIRQLKAPINGLTTTGLAYSLLRRKLECLLYKRPKTVSLPP